MFHWYVINTYSGHENKVRQNLLHRVETMSQQQKIRRVVVPTEQVVETKDGQKVQVEKRTLPGYVLVHMELDDDSWHVVDATWLAPRQTLLRIATGRDAADTAFLTNNGSELTLDELQVWAVADVLPRDDWSSLVPLR